MCLNMITSHFSIFFLLAQFVSFIIIVVVVRRSSFADVAICLTRRSVYIRRYYFTFHISVLSFIRPLACSVSSFSICTDVANRHVLKQFSVWLHLFIFFPISSITVSRTSEQASKQARPWCSTSTYLTVYASSWLYEAYEKHKTHNDIIIICSIWMSGVGNKDMSCY